MTQVLWKCMRRSGCGARDDELLYIAGEKDARAWLQEQKDRKAHAHNSFEEYRYSTIDPTSYWIEPVAVGINASMPQETQACSACQGHGFIRGPRYRKEYAG
jgi:hypothetical protein